MRSYMKRRRDSLVSGSVQGLGTLNASTNQKLVGYYHPRPVFAVYRAVGATCPADCALLVAGCYAQGGNVFLHQKRANERSFDPVAWSRTLPVGSLIRWNVSGDVVGEDGAVYRAAIKRAHESRPDLVGWLYTHAWNRDDVAEWARTLPANVTAVASLDNQAEVSRAHARGFSTVAYVMSTANGKDFSDAEAREVKGERAPGVRRPLPCPAQRVETGCADCMACTRPGEVVFAAHGARSRLASRSIAAARALPLA